MPLYSWACKMCGELYEVLRKFDDYQIPPSSYYCDNCGYHVPEDQFTDELVICPTCDHNQFTRHAHCPACDGDEFHRKIARDIAVNKSDNWGGGKGYW